MMKRSHVFALVILLILCNSVKSFSQQLHTQSNAVSIDNEANATTGWTGNATITSDTSDPQHGTYSMKVVSTGVVSTDRRVEYTYSATVGETYDISIWAKTGSQTLDPAFATWTGVTGFTNPTLISTSGTWAEYTFTVTATSTTPLILIYTGSSSGSTGDELYIDRVSITPQSSTDTQAPTAPTSLQSTGQTDTTADLSWTAATDNVGVTGYRVYKDGILEAPLANVTSYQVTGLTASTTYSFTVTALDVAGNESTPSTAASVTTDAASGGGTSVWSESGTTASYSGEVAVGTTTVPIGYKMAVDGKLMTEEVRVELSGTWPDYVFTKHYELRTLEEIQKHIEEKGHLPNIPSAQEVKAYGIELGEMNRLLLEKIEELTLHLIKVNEQNQKQKEINDQIKNELKILKKAVNEKF